MGEPPSLFHVVSLRAPAHCQRPVRRRPSVAPQGIAARGAPRRYHVDMQCTATPHGASISLPFPPPPNRPGVRRRRRVSVGIVAALQIDTERL